MAALAQRLELPVRPPELVTSAGFADALRRESVDLLLNVHSLQLVAPEVLAAPAIGSFNLHPGPLPRYAGLDVPSWAVYNRETQLRLDPALADAEIDGGPVAYSVEFDVEPEETAISLYLKCVRHGVPLVTRLVEAAAHGGADAIPALEQDREARRYFGRRPPHDALVALGARGRAAGGARPSMRLRPVRLPLGTGSHGRRGSRARGAARNTGA